MFPSEDRRGSAFAETYLPQWSPESPFLRTLGVAPRDPEAVEEGASRAVPLAALYELDSPFTSEARDGAGTYTPEAEEFVQLLANLHDEEFNEALYGLMSEASALYSDRFTGEYEDPTAQAAQAERLRHSRYMGRHESLEYSESDCGFANSTSCQPSPIGACS